MPKKKANNSSQQKLNEELFGYVHRTDLRVIALEQAIGDLLKLTPKQKEIFHKMVTSYYDALLAASMEQTEDIDAALAARLLDGQNPYSKTE